MIMRGNFYSKMLGRDTDVAVALPNTFRSGKPYRVAYLLHGLMSDAWDWLDNTMLNVFVNETGTAVIMPEGGRSFYTDMRYGAKYFSYITRELPVMAKSVFNISANREQTAVLGGSMGGYGALKCALACPEQYGFCGAMSSGGLYFGEYFEQLKRHEVKRDALFPDFEAIFGEYLVCGEVDDLPALAEKMASGAQKPYIYGVCGKQDGFLEMNGRFFGELASLGYDVQYEQIEGAHDWYYFNDALKRTLERWEEFCK